ARRARRLRIPPRIVARRDGVRGPARAQPRALYRRQREDVDAGRRHCRLQLFPPPRRRLPAGRHRAVGVGHQRAFAGEGCVRLLQARRTGQGTGIREASDVIAENGRPVTSFRQSCRALVKTPGFTAIAVLTMALGIAINTAIFSVVNAVLLRPLPFRDESRIVRVWMMEPRGRGNHSAADFLDLKRGNRTLAALAGYRGEPAAASARPGEAVQLGLQHVTAEFFDALGTPPALGRTFGAATDAGSGERVAVISDQAWERRSARDPAPVGPLIRLNGEPCTAVAVMPKSSTWPEGTGVWLLAQKPVPPSPLDVNEADPLTNRDSHYFEAIAKLKPGVTMAQ